MNAAPRVALATCTLAIVVLAPALPSQSQFYVRDPLESHLPPSIALASDFAILDLDGDAIDDLVVSSFTDDVRGFAGDGFGGFGDEILRLDDSEKLRSFELVDLDGDGDFDVLGRRLDGSFRVWLQLLPLFFNEQTAPPLEPSGHLTKADSADVDGDGAPDIVRYQQTGTLEVLVNNGAGQFFATPASQWFSPEPQDPVEQVLLEDVDGDGDVDAILATVVAPRLFVNDGSGSFTEVPNAMPAWTVAPPIQSFTDSTELLPFDADGDGDRDLLVAWLGPFGFGVQTGLWLNSGGTFADETTVRLPAGVLHTRATAADFDGDGDSDLVVTAATGQRERILINDGNGVFAVPGTARLDRPSLWSDAVTAADVDGDDDIDLLFARSDSQAMPSLQINDGTGQFIDGNRPRVEPAEAPNKVVAVGDFDGDGRVDIVADDGAGPDRLLMNRGARGFVDESASRMPSIGSTTRELVAADVDLDGDLDIICGRWASFPGQSPTGFGVLENDGTGHFVEVATVSAPSIPTSIAVGDVNGDGLPDIAFSATGSQAGVGEQNRVYVQPGWVDVTAVSLPQVDDETRDLELGDVDGDGDVDMVCANHGSNRLYLNDGTGVFSDATLGAWPLTADLTNAIALGDVDADGDLDVIEARQHQAPELHLNDGTGVFTTAFGAFPILPNLYALSIELVYYEGHDRPDVLIGENDADDKPRSVMYRNVGFSAPSFVREAPGPVPYQGTSYCPDLAVADFDNDGDPDVLLAGQPGPQIRYLRRLTTRLQSPRVPMPGRPYPLRLPGGVGSPGAAFLLSGGLLTTPIPTSFGMFELDPSQVTASFLVAWDDVTAFESSLTVPLNTTLVGTELHWQAVVPVGIGEVRLTNAVRDVIWP